MPPKEENQETEGNNGGGNVTPAGTAPVTTTDGTSAQTTTAQTRPTVTAPRTSTAANISNWSRFGDADDIYFSNMPAYGAGDYLSGLNDVTQVSFANTGARPRAMAGIRQRPLTSTRLEDSQAFYADEYLPQPPQSRIVGPPRRAIDVLVDQVLGPPDPNEEVKSIEKLAEGNAKDMKQIFRYIIKAADMIVNSKSYPKQYDVQDEEKIKTHLGSFAFETDINNQTTADQYLGQNFSKVTSRPDMDPLSKLMLEQQQLNRALNELPAGGNGDRLRADIKKKIDELDIMSAVNSFGETLIQRNLSRLAHLSLENVDNQSYISPPQLGSKVTLGMADIKALLISVNNKQFGSGQQTRSGLHYLTQVKNLCHGTYAAPACYDALSMVFGGEYLSFITTSAQENKPFHTFWNSFVQIINHESKSLSASASKKLITVMNAPPKVDLVNTLLEIHNLVAKKLKCPEYTTQERSGMFSLMIRSHLFQYVSLWYSIFLSSCKDKFKRIVERPGVTDDPHFDHFGVLFNIIVSTVGDSPPSRVPMGQPYASVSEVATALSEGGADATTAHVDALYGQGYQGASKPKTTIPPHVLEQCKGRCILCYSNQHAYRNCDRHEDKTIGTQRCHRCMGFHKNLNKCHNLASSYELEAQTNEKPEA